MNRHARSTGTEQPDRQTQRAVTSSAAAAGYQGRATDSPRTTRLVQQAELMSVSPTSTKLQQFRQLTNDSPQTRQLKQKTGAGSSNAPVQRMDGLPGAQAAWAPALHPNSDKRAADPYELQDGQVHHIISHSHLLTGLTQLDQAAQYRVRRSFLPSVDALNIRQLATIFPRIVFTNPHATTPDNVISPGLRYFESAPWSTAPLAAIPGDITLKQDNLIDTTIEEFRKAYDAVRDGVPEGPGNIGTIEFWQEVLNSFFEWSGGNLFYGAAGRAEPGGADLNELDSDAAYFRDPRHVKALGGMEARLRAENRAQHAGNIEAVLIEIGEANRDAGAGPLNAPKKWFVPAANQEALVAALLPVGPRRDYAIAHPGRSLPRAFLRERIRSSAAAKINDALKDRDTRETFSGVVSAAANNAHRWKGSIQAAAAVTLNLWGTDFVLTKASGGEIHIAAIGLQSTAYPDTDVTSVAQAIECLKSGLENLF